MHLSETIPFWPPISSESKIRRTKTFGAWSTFRVDQMSQSSPFLENDSRHTFWIRKFGCLLYLRLPSSPPTRKLSPKIRRSEDPDRVSRRDAQTVQGPRRMAKRRAPSDEQFSQQVGNYNGRNSLQLCLRCKRSICLGLFVLRLLERLLSAVAFVMSTNRSSHCV